MSQQTHTQAIPHTNDEEAVRSNRASAPPQPHPGVRMTYEEFLAWANEDTLAEWVDGEVAMTSPASLRHQVLKSFIHGLLSSFVAVHDLGIVLDAPFQMKLPASGREPDVLYLARAHEARLTSTYVDGPGDVVVEIVSDESVERDSETKFVEYQEGRVPEYWLIDPRPGRERADFYQLDDNGRYQPAIIGQDGIYRSRAVLHFWLRIPWLWQQPLPDPTDGLLEIDRDAYARYLREKLRQAGV